MKALCLLLALSLPAAARAGGSFDSGYGIWSPSGLWHRVTAPACVSPHTGSACVYYGIDSSCTYDNGQVQDASLTTLAPVALTASTAFISFWLLYDVQSLDPACQDRLRLEYSPDSTHWYLEQELGAQSDPSGGSPQEGFASGSGVGGPPLWQFVDLKLSSFAGTSYYWRLRYLSSDEQAGNALCGPPDLLQGFLGYAIDDVNIGDPAPPLALQKSASPSLGAPGGSFTFTLSVTNTSAASATVSVWDTLPAGYSSASASPPGSVSGGLAQWTLPDLGPGQSASVQLQVQAAPGLVPPVDWINTAAASCSLSAAVVLSSQVLVKLRTPALVLTKSVSPTSLTSGNTATYSLVLENDTAVTQSALTITDTPPPAFSPTESYPALSGNTYWNLGPLAPGQIFSCMLSGPVLGQNGQVVVNTAQVGSGSTVLGSASASLSVSNPVSPSITIQAVFPNPAPSRNPSQPQEAFVAYTLSTAMPVNLDIYDVAGEKVRSLSAPGNQGEQQVAWDLKNSFGLNVASGLYVLRLWSPAQSQPAAQATATLAVRR
ncbi:MAG TPA: hypothetical protein VK914_01230 [bacterium]|nr:hypothetical protein [bacterium]